ncbi:MAG: hypothetical protein H6825_10870 [Planctomycetes bacterium]|nr:hypothetical protein [Planctomycetota bacterium]
MFAESDDLRLRSPRRPTTGALSAATPPAELAADAPSTSARNGSSASCTARASLLLAGTDTSDELRVSPVRVSRRLALLVEAGLTPLEALRTATLHPALARRRRPRGLSASAPPPTCCCSTAT